jgi:hypothetical protein
LEEKKMETMKNYLWREKMKIFLSKTCFVTATVLLAAMVAIAGCDNSGGGGDETGGKGNGTDPFNLSGIFKNKNNGDVNFFVKRDESSSRSVFRSALAIGPLDYFLSGYLEDEGTVYELFGYYSPVSETYALSASSADMRYNLYGHYDPAEGIAASGDAIVSSSPGGVWAASSPIEVEPFSEAPAIAGTPVANDIENGLPLEMHGIWYYEGAKVVSTAVNAFSIVHYVLAETGEWTMGIWASFEPTSAFYTEVIDEGGGIFGAIAAFPGMNLYSKTAFKIVGDKLFAVSAALDSDYETVKANTNYTWPEFGYTRVPPVSP